MADPVPKPPAYDAKTCTEAWTQGVLKPDGTPYSAFAKFAPWKSWADRLRDYVESNRIAIRDVKAHTDTNSAQIQVLKAEVKALQDKPTVPFPGSG